MNKKLKIDALKLPISDRLELAEHLWNSVTQAHANAGVTAAQIEEAERRLDEYYANPAIALPWERVKAGLLHRSKRSAKAPRLRRGPIVYA